MRKPSASISTGASAIRVMVIFVLLVRLVRVRFLPAVGIAGRCRHVAAGQQGVPVDPLEGELAQVVEPRLPQQRQRPTPVGKRPGSGSVS